MLQDALATPLGASRTAATLVTFTPGARTDWHGCKTPQVFVATIGIGMIEVRGKPSRVLRAGGVAEVPPGLVHWHGAVAGRLFAHISFLDIEGPYNNNRMEPVDSRFEQLVHRFHDWRLAERPDLEIGSFVGPSFDYDLEALTRQHLAIILGVVAGLVTESGRVGIMRLQARVVGISVDHHAPGVTVTQRYVHQLRDVCRAEPGRKRPLIDRPRPERADTLRYRPYVTAVIVASW